ncbi:GspE/PulE family protein [Roseobacter sp. HKCCD7870]|uniref:GspE/PulE family protein n=1 Tax=Roseobacter sp. HKCCD7870 TaxID=3120343 RepID=UPI0030EE2250
MHALNEDEHSQSEHSSTIASLRTSETNPVKVADIRHRAFPQVSLCLDAIVAEAMDAGSSDIHIEPYEVECRLRIRESGVLEEKRGFARYITQNYDALIARIKIVAGLDIAEKRLPQDGAFTYKVKNREIDLRVSILPTKHGERVVMRLLDKSGFEISLANLNLPTDSLNLLIRSIYRTQGLVLVTGPTGSGKSTTLYAALTELNCAERNILTAEDPVEYQLDGVGQVQVREDIGLTFEAALRSFLRQDPEVLLIGEIRDRNTADIAIKASLTGHLVLSTLHTNDAVATVTRLINMGIAPYLISASLELVVAQRLLRKICPHCKAPHPNQNELWEQAHFMYGHSFMSDKRIFYHGTGCEACNHTGYKGRMAIYEMFSPSDAAKNLITNGANYSALYEQAKADGLHTLIDDAVRLVDAGETSLSEVVRVLSS